MKKPKRVVTNEDVKRYEPMVNKYIRDSVIKNWNEASSARGQDEISLGNSGLTISDMRQYLLTEVVVALQNYNPDYRTPKGVSVKESTFVFGHLSFRIGQTMKKLTKKRYGYGFWSNDIEQIQGERFDE